jgi:hypothetical protein
MMRSFNSSRAVHPFWLNKTYNYPDYVASTDKMSNELEREAASLAQCEVSLNLTRLKKPG